MRCRALEILNLSITNITDETLLEIAHKEGKKLRTLDICFCRQVTNQGIENFLENSPNLQTLVIEAERGSKFLAQLREKFRKLQIKTISR